MWFTWARSNTYSPSPARVAPGVRAACCAMVILLAVFYFCRSPSGEFPRRGLVAGREQSPRAPAQNRALVTRRNRKASDLQHTVRHSHIERIIAAEKHAVGTGIVDQELEHLLRVHDGVEIKPVDRLGRRFRQLLLRLGAHVP